MHSYTTPWAIKTCHFYFGSNSIKFYHCGKAHEIYNETHAINPTTPFTCCITLGNLEELSFSQYKQNCEPTECIVFLDAAILMHLGYLFIT